jgi:moderate conductance mechanosensitive channel
MLFGDAQLNQTIQQSNSILKQISDTFFNAESIFVLIVALVTATLLGRIVAAVLRWFTKLLSKRADKVTDLGTVNRLRRFETITVLSIALIRTLLVLIALYFWWVYTHPHQRPTAIIGASALFVLILGGVLSPLLRDMAYGGVMMAEHWFGVGDHITIEPFTLQGVVERVTLRSTRIRSLNGEVIWVSNQNIAAVRIAPKGLLTMALEIFVNDIQKGLDLIDETNLRLPTGPLMVVSPLTVMTQVQVGPDLWHITSLAETAPERQWLIDTFAIQVIKEIDDKSKSHVLIQEPFVRNADSEAERRFAQSIKNAQKPKRQRSITKRSKSRKP